MDDGDQTLRWHGPGIVTLREGVMAPNGRVYRHFFSKLWRAETPEGLGIEAWTGRAPTAPPPPIFVAIGPGGVGEMLVDPAQFAAHVQCEQAPRDLAPPGMPFIESGYTCYDLSAPVAT